MAELHRRETRSYAIQSETQSYVPFHGIDTILAEQSIVKVSLPSSSNPFRIHAQSEYNGTTETMISRSVFDNPNGFNYSWLQLPHSENITPLTLSLKRNGSDVAEFYSNHWVMNTTMPDWKTVPVQHLFPFFTDLTANTNTVPLSFQMVQTEQGNLIATSEPDRHGYFLIGGKSGKHEKIVISNGVDTRKDIRIITDMYNGVWGMILRIDSPRDTIMVSCATDPVPLQIAPKNIQ